MPKESSDFKGKLGWQCKPRKSLRGVDHVLDPLSQQLGMCRLHLQDFNLNDDKYLLLSLSERRGTSLRPNSMSTAV